MVRIEEIPLEMLSSAVRKRLWKKWTLIQGVKKFVADVPPVICRALDQAQEISNKSVNVNQEVRVLEANNWVARYGG